MSTFIKALDKKMGGCTIRENKSLGQGRRRERGCGWHGKSSSDGRAALQYTGQIHSLNQSECTRIFRAQCLFDCKAMLVLFGQHWSPPARWSPPFSGSFSFERGLVLSRYARADPDQVFREQAHTTCNRAVFIQYPLLHVLIFIPTFNYSLIIF